MNSSTTDIQNTPVERSGLAQSPVEQTSPLTAAPGSTVVVRDEEWLVTSIDQGAPDPETNSPTYFVSCTGLTGITKDTSAVFWTQLDAIVQADPRLTEVVADDSPSYRRSRL